jgi:quercetin dioxygenase-like cupin family protein
MTMAERVSPTVVRGNDAGWQSTKVPGVSVRPLRRNAETGESTALVRFAAGARFPAHNHPAGEEVFVLEGDVLIGPDRLKAGDYLYTPPGGKHAAASDGGCVFLVTLPKPVEILPE